MLYSILISLSLLITTTTSATTHTQPNLLLIIADDLGVDALKNYNYSQSTAHTPNLNKLAKSGVSFTNFWATPACTTTRGAIMTGKHGFESSIDHVPAIIPDNSLSIQARLKQSDIQTPYKTGVFGKWHLGGRSPDSNHPAKFSIDKYAGNLFNLDDYYDWELTTNGNQTDTQTYHTTKITDLAIDFINNNQGSPWFAWLAYSAPHKPFHTPPEHLTNTKIDFPSVTQQYHLMIESMDTEIGRLIASIPQADLDNTVIMFLGDNGSPKRTRDKSIFAKDHVKGSLYEGGIRAPLIVAGSSVTRKGSLEHKMVNATDIFSTMVELATNRKVSSNTPKNSFSFKGLLDNSSHAHRTHNYSEWKTKNDGLSWTVRDNDHKVIYRDNGKTELFSTDNISETNPINDAKRVNAMLTVGRTIRDGNPVASKHITSYQTHSSPRCFTGDGLPNHDTGTFPNRGNPNSIKSQNLNLCVEQNPTKNTQIDTTHRGSVGVALSGIQFRPATADYYDSSSHRGFSRDSSSGWNLEGIGARDMLGMDHQNAHVDHRGLYHYHAIPEILKNTNNSLIGYAADGFEIHYSSTQSSSYALKSGHRHSAPYGNHDGTYVEDWEFIQNSGTLDKCNGANINGKYSYFATDTYPFFPRCFWGNASDDFKTGQRGSQNRNTNHQPQPPQHHQPSPTIFSSTPSTSFSSPRAQACSNQDVGSSCTFETRRGHQRSGTCSDSRNQGIICRPNQRR